MKLLVKNTEFQEIADECMRYRRVEADCEDLVNLLCADEWMEQFKRYGMEMRREGRQMTVEAFGVTAAAAFEPRRHDGSIIGSMVLYADVEATAASHAHKTALFEIQCKSPVEFRFVADQAVGDWIYVDAIRGHVDRCEFARVAGHHIMYFMRRYAIGDSATVVVEHV